MQERTLGMHVTCGQVIVPNLAMSPERLQTAFDDAGRRKPLRMSVVLLDVYLVAQPPDKATMNLSLRNRYWTTPGAVVSH